ncbi:hypothetical protein LMJF_15_0570 [Leishmania major strain Friedlin]|uniref:Uncharacterized protein n=1 Tax=Leishmania major TaxID=5664 RepID=Q4QFC8_LEIMA|nr:hypothetical protein LMJF_15_0570 [Leishmania major strain Friedlin]CAG9571403.1 hypothetical_protein_-_conserved [Leishmania major strain Friedlin]CAJ03281.1 hypothetical protein LMJF_15_0570 [Leishmania major strain Friedlin]|eukprot:XP_001681970.1 hypothetical protein LMJF_15_0570 [Leishmania major strain Friedlin]
MTLFLSAVLPVPMRLAPLLLGTLLLLAAAARANTADAPYRISTRVFPECSAYADQFPYMQTTIDCIVKSLCVTRKHCCKNVHETDLSRCLDITAFSCDTAAVCANHTAASPSSSSSTSPWFPETQDGGASLTCCHAAAATTEAPAVPPLDDGSSGEVSHNSGLQPELTCDDTTSIACMVMPMLSPTIRAFCQNDLLNMYTDAYLYDNVPRMCCQHLATGPLNSSSAEPSNTGKVACGLKLLDLPRTGEYHCSLDMRNTASICCNGRIEYDVNSSSRDAASAALSGENLVFTYISSKCLFRPETNGNSVSSPAMSVAWLLTVAALSVMAMHLCM